jgi:phosphate transport system permease protein
MSEQPDKANPHSLTRPPTGNEIRFDRGFQLGTRFFALAGLGLLVAILLVIGYDASPAVAEHGAGFLVDTTWDPNEDEFGILPQILGTLYSSVIALILGGGLGIFAAIYLSQGFLPPAIEKVMKNIIELLAAIPSVVYGLWGIFVVIPALRGPCEWLHENLSFIPFFSTKLSGPGVLPASLVLSIMILPTVARRWLARGDGRGAEAPEPRRVLRPGRDEAGRRSSRVVLPTASTGVFGAVVHRLRPRARRDDGPGHARGQRQRASAWSLFSPGRTLASLLANPVPGGRQGRGGGADVRRDRAAGDHPGSSTSWARWSWPSASKRPAGAATDAAITVQSNDPRRILMRDEHLFEEIRLEKSLRHLRIFVSTIPHGTRPSALTLAGSVPAVLGALHAAHQGRQHAEPGTLFTELPASAWASAGGGIGNAVVGTLVTVGLAGADRLPARASWPRSSSRSSGSDGQDLGHDGALRGEGPDRHAVDPRRRVRLRGRRGHG